jgi:glycosyltransferase involved in cell wall biosynthesis
MSETIPLVSVYCLTYNHEKYIRKALDGILMQKTDFDFEIIISEDKSTDNTISIIAEYEKRFPGRLTVLYHEKNLYSQNIDILKTDFYRVARGKYCALCEGDDYWTDPLKLQKQVDILEQNPDCSLSFHNSKVIFEHGERESYLSMNKWYKNKLKFSARILIDFEYNISTASMMYRREAFKPDDWYTSEKSLQLALSTNGDIIYLSDVMSVYRVNNQGVSYHNTILRATILMIDIYNWFDQYSNGAYSKVIRKKKKRLVSEYLCNRTITTQGKFYLFFKPTLLCRMIFYKIKKYYRILVLNIF